MNPKVLIVDDDDAILKSLQKALKSNHVDINSIQLIKSKDRDDAIKFMSKIQTSE